MWESGGIEGNFCYLVLPPSLPPGGSFYSFHLLFCHELNGIKILCYSIINDIKFVGGDESLLTKFF